MAPALWYQEDQPLVWSIVFQEISVVPIRLIEGEPLMMSHLYFYHGCDVAVLYEQIWLALSNRQLSLDVFEQNTISQFRGHATREERSPEGRKLHQVTEEFGRRILVRH
jgi:hypothetical protein